MKIKEFLLIVLVLLISLSADAGVYKFEQLADSLGYPNETYFGSTEEEIQDLETYTTKDDNFYKEINSFLRYFPKAYEWNGIGPADAKVMVNHIDHIFARVPSLPQDLILFRGIDLKFRESKSFKVGDEVIEKGYVSTTTSFNVAEYFAIELPSMDEQPSTARKAIFTYYINDKNLKGILIDGSESEVILKHGIKIRVMDLRNTHTPYDFYLAQICVKACEKIVDLKAREVWLNIYNQRKDQ
jgi:hypothetical protein